MLSNTAIVTSPIMMTSRVPRVRLTSTLSITTWKNSGDTSENNCRKNDATSTSARWRRYLWMAPRNQEMSNRRDRSSRPARRVIRTIWPSQILARSVRAITSGREESGDWTIALSSLTFPMNRKLPSLSAAIPGKGVVASRSQVVRYDLTFSPNSLAQRTISDTPTTSLPSRWRNCSGSTPTPWN